MRKKHEKIIQNISLLIEQSEFEKAAKYFDDTTLGEDTPADLFFLLAIVLNGVKRNDESLELYSRALRKNPNFWQAFHNRGTLLLQYSKFEASISDLKNALHIRDNIDSRVNLGIAFNNSATEFIEIGEIKDALENYLQCRKYQPVCKEAIRNLYSLFAQVPYLFSDSESMLFYDFSEAGFEEPIIVQCYLMIIHLLSGNIKQFRLAHKRLRVSLFVNKESNETSFDVKFSTSYFNMLAQFTAEECEFFTNDKCPAIYHLGESHCLSFSHQRIIVRGQQMVIKPKIIFGAKVWHLVKTRPNRYRGILRSHIKSIPNNSIIFLSFGEIDCRQNEGYLKKHLRFSETLKQSIESDVKKYVSMIADSFSNHNAEIFIFSVPAPVIENSELSEQDKSQISVIEFFNRTLCATSKVYKLGYVDTYSLTVNEKGISNRIFHSDARHLSARILSKLNLFK